MVLLHSKCVKSNFKKSVFAVTKRILNHARPFNVALVFFSTLNLLLVSLISVTLDYCKDDSLKMSVVFLLGVGKTGGIY